MKTIRHALIAFALVLASTAFAAEEATARFTALKTPLEPTPEMLAAGTEAETAFKATASLSSMDAPMAAAAGKATQEEPLNPRRH
ncbi:MAG TPA: hypothetical protein DCY26_08190, partial [Hyphomonas sp.]|nr:hypothetical protein [Hyphomonas sp.]